MALFQSNVIDNDVAEILLTNELKAAHLQAKCSGVFPSLSLLLTSHFLSVISNFTMSKCPHLDVDAVEGYTGVSNVLIASTTHMSGAHKTKSPQPHGFRL